MKEKEAVKPKAKNKANEIPIQKKTLL
jgi:hypothetical protein